MKEAILILALLMVFIFVYFLMRKLDVFLNKNRTSIENESEKKEPSFVMLTDELSDEEITSEVRRFRSKHRKTKIFLYESTDTEHDEL